MNFPPQSRTPHLDLDRRETVEAVEAIENQIRVIRGHAVLLDVDLAGIYGVSVRHLLDRVRREEPLAGEMCMTPEREELAAHEEFRPGCALPRYAFTEHGAFLAGIFLQSRTARAVSVQIVRAFRRYRERPDNHSMPLS